MSRFTRVFFVKNYFYVECTANWKFHFFVDIDILFGNRQQISDGNEFMAKKVGFTYSVLNQTFSEAGFQVRYGGRMPNNGGELAIVAFKQRKSEDEIKKIADPLLFG